MGLQGALCEFYRLSGIRDRKCSQLCEHQAAMFPRLRLDSRLMRVFQCYRDICHEFLRKVVVSHEATHARTGAIVQTLRDCYSITVNPFLRAGNLRLAGLTLTVFVVKGCLA